MTTYRNGFTQIVPGQFGAEFVINNNHNRMVAFGDGSACKNRSSTQPPKSYRTAAAADIEFHINSGGPGPRGSLILAAGTWTTTWGFAATDTNVVISGSEFNDGIYTVDEMLQTNTEMVFVEAFPILVNVDNVQTVDVFVLPTVGDAYIVNGTGTGLWAGHDDALAAWYSGWIFQDPFEGLRTWLTETTDEKLLYRNGAWVFI